MHSSAKRVTDKEKIGYQSLKLLTAIVCSCRVFELFTKAWTHFQTEGNTRKITGA